jgi:hypothetical protein
MGMENLKNGIKIEKLDICPFFFIYDQHAETREEKTRHSCKEEVNFFYVVEYCVKGYRRCKKFTERALLERKTPQEWIDVIACGLSTLDLEDCFGVYDYIRCPVYPDCGVDVVYDHFVEKCCKDFDKCDNFLKAAYYTDKPSAWSEYLKRVVYVEKCEDDDW